MGKPLFDPAQYQQPSFSKLQEHQRQLATAKKQRDLEKQKREAVELLRSQTSAPEGDDKDF